MNALKENKGKEKTGSKKSKRKLLGLSRRIRHSIMLDSRENNRLKLCISYNV